MLSQMFVQPKTDHELMKSTWKQATSLQDPVEVDVTTWNGDFTQIISRKEAHPTRQTYGSGVNIPYPIPSPMYERYIFPPVLCLFQQQLNLWGSWCQETIRLACRRAFEVRTGGVEVCRERREVFVP